MLYVMGADLAHRTEYAKNNMLKNKTYFFDEPEDRNRPPSVSGEFVYALFEKVKDPFHAIKHKSRTGIHV